MNPPLPAEGRSANQPPSFPIVGIGASAGGLETLEAFFASMPPETGIAFVIIQHLSPNFKSIMASLLAKLTPMPVSEIEDGMATFENRVYLNPPNKNVALFNRTLHVMEPIKNGTINMPIDFFFRSLSEDRKEKAIGIIVLGTASDGTLGIKAIKGEGGMVMVQDPDTAKYDGMPGSAIGTGLVDFVLGVEQMPNALIGYVKHPFLRSPGKINISETTIQHQLQKVFGLIRSATGHDFSQYKPTTIRRRIERRLAVHQIDNLSGYIIYMQKNPREIDALFKDLVIGVTGLFRDPEAYQVIEEKVIPRLLQGKQEDDTLRCWVVGCSTGEEAYSLAMIVSEAIEKLEIDLDVQVFATDIDAAAIETARKGIYPDSIAAETEILSEDGIWHVLKVTPYRTAENVIAGVVVTVMDIHKVKQADKIRRLATVLKDAHDAITVRDFNGRILAWNKGAERMYGWTEKEALEMNFSTLVPPQSRTSEISLMDKLKSGDPVSASTMLRMTKGGKRLDVWLVATALTDDSGQPIEIATTERDLAWLPLGGGGENGK